MLRLILSIFFTALLFSCGGSGGGSGSSPTVPTTPTTPTTPVDSASKNILFIISDDQGLDAASQYSFSNDLPATPTLNELADGGLVFDNAWATPACTPTRATVLTGKYPSNTGVTFVPAVLSDEHTSIQSLLTQNDSTDSYASAVFGKWHVAGGNPDPNHPNSMGVEHYAGNIGNIEDYFDWELTVNGQVSTVSEYHTTAITDLAIEWIGEQSTPWFAWVAYSAPHVPFHAPPNTLHNRNLSGTSEDISANPRNYYLAAIEAMDTEIARLLDTLDDDTRENTVIIYMGDNGTPGRVIDTSVYANDHGKNTLYQGGVAVPLIVSGAGVTRAGEREDALVTATDLYATIAQMAGITDSEIEDSLSFFELLSDADAAAANQAVTEFESALTSGVAVRDAQYKLIRFDNGDTEFYDLSVDFDEQQNIDTDGNVASIRTTLLEFANEVRSVNTAIDITDAILVNRSANCADYIANYESNVRDVNRDLSFFGDLSVSFDTNRCIFTTNAIPNHDFNDGDTAFPNEVAEQNDVFEITSTPSLANSKTPLDLNFDNAILMNGVKVDILAAACFGVGDEKVGCNDMSIPWRFDPMHGPNGFRVDSHNAHAQPDGTYHYHGSPLALFSQDSTSSSPLVGFAADGFPIYGSYFDDGQSVRKALSSYRLREGERPSGDGEPGGSYDGAFRDDYEYVEGLGDLDECNGMLIDGVYAYYITDVFPYVLGCFSGTPDESFRK